MNWSGLYDRTYNGDDAEKRAEFHRGSQAIMKEQVREMCRMGTMACNADALAKRRQLFQIRQAYPHADRGAFTQLFYVAQDQRYKPLPGDRKEGGVIKDFRYAQHLLKQREADFKNQEAQQQGLPPVAPSMLELTPEESQSLELNNLLTQLDDSIETGALSGIEAGDLKNMWRLLVRLSTTFDEKRIVDLIQYFQSLEPGLKILQDNDNKYAITVLRFVKGMIGYLQDMAKIVNRSPSEKTLAAKSFVNKHFKLFSPTERRELTEPVKRQKEAKRAAEEQRKKQEEMQKSRIDAANKIKDKIPSDEKILADFADTVPIETVKEKSRAIRKLYKSVFGTTRAMQTSKKGLRDDALRMAKELRDLAGVVSEPPEEEEEEEEATGSAKRIDFKNERLNRL